MKRVILSITGTVAGLVALLTFKSQAHPVHVAGPLPSAGAPTPSSEPASNPASTRGAAGPGSSSVRASTASKSHTILGNAEQTQYGVVQVQVTITGTHIDNVSFVQLQAFDGHSQEINSQAAPILLQETLAAQSSHIDSVSGATYTSDGYVQSLQSALDQAGIR